MVLIFLAAACLKPTPPLETGAGRTVVVVNLLDAPTDAPATDTPERLDRAVLDAVSTRKLVPRLLEAAVDLAPAHTSRETAPRLRALTAAAGDNAVLLVETRPVFYSELNGQYRWTVGVVVSLEGPGAPAARSFDVPVFLQYHHEREADAVDAAAPIVARKVGELLDGWLGGGG